MPDHDEREAQILRAATAVLLRQGYDRTTMSDIAEGAGVSRGTVYLHFKGKEELFEALLYWEWTQYSQVWLEAIESDPRGGTIGGFYRALFHAVSSRPLMSSIMRRDRRVLGNYLRKPDNLVAWIESGSTTVDLIKALQRVGAVRQDLDPEVTAHLTECPFLNVSCKEGWYHVNSDWVVFEPVDADYRPVSPGTQSPGGKYRSIIPLS